MHLLREIRLFVKNLLTISPTKPPFHEPTGEEKLEAAIERGKTAGPA